MRCLFLSASDDELVCDANRRGSSTRKGLRSSRKYISEVRLEHPEANAAAGAAIGGGIGAALGASRGPDSGMTRGGGALLLGSLGATVGWFFGRDFGPVHGKVIYRNEQSNNP